MNARLASLGLLVLTGCGSSSKASGAAALVAWGMVGSNGLCEDNPCGLGCGAGERCDLHTPVPRCVDATAPTDLFRSPPPPPSLPIAAPPP